MLFEKISNELMEHFIAEFDKNGYIEKLKTNIITPTMIHASKYFNKYIMYFYAILILLIVFIISLIIIMLRLMTKIEIIMDSLKQTNLVEIK